MRALLIVLILLLTHCGSNQVDGLISCYTTQSTNGAYISCSDGSSSFVADGANSIIASTPATTQQCPNGGVVYMTGIDTNKNGILDASDSDIETSVVCSGTNGATGAQGNPGPATSPSPFLPVGVVTPCGPNSSAYKEVLLVLADGSLLGSFSDNVTGYNTRLAFIPDGSYIDTDSSGCNFTVATNGHTRTVSWLVGTYWSAGSTSWTF